MAGNRTSVWWWALIGLGVVSVIVVGGLSCLKSVLPPTARFEIVLEPGFEGELKLVENAKVVPDRHGVFVLRQHESEIHVPPGFVTGSFSPSFFTVVRVVDTQGKVLSIGDDPAPGQIGLRGYGTNQGTDPSTGKVYDGTYFTFARH